jgi:2-polyprenyl-3-methyl-5-hydroxy-6-metoxy-1,4-benzoquinol methylase
MILQVLILRGMDRFVLKFILSYMNESAASDSKTPGHEHAQGCGKERRKGGTMIDVGCGSGQSTRVWSPYFSKVYGFDVSETQISEAQDFQGIPQMWSTG